MEQFIFDIDPCQSTLYNISRDYPCVWRELQTYSKYANLDIPYLHKITVKKILNIPTSNFYKLKNRLSLDSLKNHVLPMAVRYISNENVYVVERPPFQLEVDFRLGGATSENAMMPPVKIWVPWTVMIFHANSVMAGSFSQVRLFFNSGPIESMNQSLVPCFYPNTHHDAKICFAGSLNDFNNVLDLSLINEGNIGYIYNYIFNNYMMGGWNSDLSQNIVEAFSNIDRITLAEKYPMINLYLNPISDKQFYEKLSTVFPKKFFGRIKRYYLDKINLRKISREKYYSRNFGIFATFTLEQTINFIKEIQSIFASNTGNRNTLSKILEQYKPQSSNANFSSGINSVTKIIDTSIEYDYLQCKVDFFVINVTEIDGEPRTYHDQSLKIPSEQVSAINYALINFLNTREENEHIAFIYDNSLKTFDILINYDAETYITNIIDASIEAIKIASTNANHNYSLIKYLQRIDDRMQEYNDQLINN